MEKLMDLIKQQSEEVRASFLQIMLESEKYLLLERGGVDNWEWYGESLYPNDINKLEEKEKELRKELGLEEKC
jgi:hypothetical protein